MAEAGQPAHPAHRRSARQSERGAIVILAAVAMLTLLGFAAFAVDYGMFWAARAQSQTSADMAAMSAAVSWALDVPNADAEDATETDKKLREDLANESAEALALENAVLKVAPTVDVSVPTAESTNCPDDVPAIGCIRVDAYRDDAHGNPLSTHFAHLFGGITALDMKATSTAGVLLAGASDCLAPFALSDRWQEVNDGDFNQEKSKFQKYEKDLDEATGLPKLLKDPDVYVAPGPGGTGYKLTDPAYGGKKQKKSMKVDDFQWKVKKDKNEVETFLKEGVKAKAYLALDIPRVDGKTEETGYSENFATCSGQVVRIGDYVSMLNAKDNKKLNEATGVAIDTLVALDLKAQFKDGKVKDSCAQSNPPCAGAKNGLSPRILNVPLFDPDDWTECVVNGTCPGGGKKDVRIVNIAGFFVECNKTEKDGSCKADSSEGKFKGWLIPALGQVVAGPPPIDGDFSYLRSLAVVR